MITVILRYDYFLIWDDPVLRRWEHGGIYAGSRADYGFVLPSPEDMARLERWGAPQKGYIYGGWEVAKVYYGEKSTLGFVYTGLLDMRKVQAFASRMRRLLEAIKVLERKRNEQPPCAELTCDSQDSAGAQAVESGRQPALTADSDAKADAEAEAETDAEAEADAEAQVGAQPQLSDAEQAEGAGGLVESRLAGADSGSNEGDDMPAVSDRPSDAPHSGREAADAAGESSGVPSASESEFSPVEIKPRAVRLSTGESIDLFEVEDNPPIDMHSYGGGGGQARALLLKLDANARVLARALGHLFSPRPDIFRKTHGFELWDAYRVARAVSVAPHELKEAKFARPRSQRVWLWIDVSNSVSYLAEDMIRPLIAGAAIYRRVEVVIGSEAHPQRWLDLSDYLRGEKDWWDCRAYKEWEYERFFDDNVAQFLRDVDVAPDDLIVVWCDYMDIHIREKQLVRLLGQQPVLWLCSHAGKDEYYHGNESRKIERLARLQPRWDFIWDISTPERALRALKVWQIKRKGVCDD